MKIDRREFFTTAARFGLTIPFWSLVPISRAQTAPYAGKFLVQVHADGGLDQSSWADPRATDGTINNYAAAGTPVVTAGNIRAAPMGNNAAFFTRFAPMMLVINGVHAETNSHDDGVRCNATGRLDMGYPNLTELFASVHGKNTPFAWLNQGGFRTSAGLVPPTAIPNANTLISLATPNAQNTTTDFMKQADVDKSLAARAARVAAMQADSQVPRWNSISDQYKAATDSRAMLSRVSQFIPATFDAGFQSAHAGLVAAQAGITTTIQLSTGGFDGHDNLAGGYDGAGGALARLTDLVTYLWDKAATLNIANRMVVRIYTDFGRTTLNNGNGKDHWEAGGSTVIMENGVNWGNRVVGATGPRHEAVMINPTSGAVVQSGGVVIRPRHVHAALRNYLAATTADPKFDLRVPANEMIDFFNPALSTGYPNP